MQYYIIVKSGQLFNNCTSVLKRFTAICFYEDPYMFPVIIEITQHEIVAIFYNIS